MKNTQTFTHEEVKGYLRKKVEILQRSSENPQAQLGELQYNGVVSPVIICGARGTDKAASVKELAQEFGLQCVVIQPTAAQTLESVEEELSNAVGQTGRMGFLVFDSIASVTANHSSRIAAYNLIDAPRRSYRQFKLPAKWIVVVTSDNGGSEGYVTLEPEFLSRGAVFNIAE